MGTRFRLIEVGGIVILAVALFSWSAMVDFLHPPWWGNDESAHWMMADTLARGEGYVDARIHMHFPLMGPGLYQDIEGTQPPVFYLLAAGVDKAVRLVPHAWLGGHTLFDATVHALRLLNAFLFGVLIVLLWLGARAITPRGVLFHLALPASIFMWAGMIDSGSHVTNDVLPGVLATGVIGLALRWRDHLDWRRGLVLGAACGVTMLAKYTGAYAGLVVVLLAVAASIPFTLERVRRLVGFLAMVAAAAAAVMSPWLLFLWRRYGGFGPISKMVASVAPPDVIFHYPSSGLTLGYLVSQQHYFYWNIRTMALTVPMTPELQTRTTALFVVAALAAILGVIALFYRPVWLSRWEALALIASLPGMLALLFMYSWTAGVTLVGGRYLLPVALPLGLLVTAWLMPRSSAMRTPLPRGEDAGWGVRAPLRDPS